MELLDLPEGAQVGEQATCDRPLLAPMDAERQRRVVRAILENCSRWSMEQKLDNYRKLHGRHLGLTLAPIEEAELAV